MGFGTVRPNTNFGGSATAVGVNPEIQVQIPDINNPGEFVSVPGNSVNSIEGGATLALAGRFLGLDLLGALDLAETNGLVTTLSQPNLTALSGETADFLAGGEFPIPVSQGLGTTAIEYRKFGVSLAYTPTVLANGRISMRVRPEVSELSTQGAVTLNGFQVPALTIRRAETTVELGSGQSFMIAGLMSNNANSSIEKAPGIGDVPILGNLFRSKSFRKGETELVIVVTPYLVNPVNDGDIRLPTDGFRTASELESLIGFQEHSGVSGARRPGPTAIDKTAPPPAISTTDPQNELPMATRPPPAASTATTNCANRVPPQPQPHPVSISSEEGLPHAQHLFPQARRCRCPLARSDARRVWRYAR